jgi:hypothetical protein
MDLLTREFLDFAREKRADLVGVAPIDRFEDVAADHHPQAIFPETRSVVVIGKRITRGTLRGVEEGTQFDIYGQYGLAWLKDRMLAVTTIALATWLEDHRWEACPIQDLDARIPPSGVAVRPGLPAPNVMIDVREAAVRAGLGEIGFGGRTMTVGAIDYSACRRCQNGARPNGDHPAGLPDRLAALCVRSCVHHLDQTRAIANALDKPFRQRPAWARNAQGEVSLVENVSA